MGNRDWGTPKRAVAGLLFLATLVIGGLVWVTVTALQVEANEAAMTVRAETINRERLALWRLDSSMLAPLGLENNRPSSHYSTLANPAALVLDEHLRIKADAGLVPSPLLTADLPDWMTLHVALGAEQGWTSPQVVPDHVLNTLVAEPVALDVRNATTARRQTLQQLQQQFPVATTMDTLLNSEGKEDPLPPLPMSDEPASSKPSRIPAEPVQSPPDQNTRALPATVEQVKEMELLKKQQLQNGLQSTRNGTVLEQFPEAQQRKKTFESSLAARGGYEPQSNMSRSNMALPREQNLKAAAPIIPVPTLPTKSKPDALTEAGSSIGNGHAKPGDDGLAASAKPQPSPWPTFSRVGELRPHWLIGSDGEAVLFLMRSTQVGSRLVFQGILIDWPKLQLALLGLVRDLFPQASVRALQDRDDSPPERTMTTLPVQLDPNSDEGIAAQHWSPLRFGLVIAWAAALLAMVATALGARAVLAMANRRMQFVSAVTHELRTPLTALQLHLDLLNSGLITEEAKKAEYLLTLAGESDRLNRLVENVLGFAKLEGRAAQTNARPVLATHLLAELERTWGMRLRGDGFELLAESTVPSDVMVHADPCVLEQLLGNLIDNARKYAKSAGDRHIRIRLQIVGTDRIAFDVQDAGPGVPSQERRSIFKPFVRGSRNSDSGGVGLGLALAREWAERFGGTLTLLPQQLGACFRLELPILDSV